MPIKIPNSLPATETLFSENIFVITETRALTQDIRPLKIAILNLMPTKIATETQLARLLGNTPLQVELELVQMSTHESRNTPQEHMLAFYKNFSDIKDQKFDGMIITGAPVEHLEFEDVDKDPCHQHLPYLLGGSGGAVLSLRHRQAASRKEAFRRVPPLQGVCREHADARI